MTRYALLVVLAACGGHDAGSEGPAGPAGPPGPTGPQGPPGMVTVLDGGVLQGPPGPEGPAGPAGATGATGAPGATGAAGPMGPMGAMGAVGASGSAGATGPAGPAGAAGAQGAQGVAGAQGPNGSQFGEAAAVFAGFSPTPISGAAGSREKMHAACAAAFTGSHLCHESEYLLANSATTPPAAGAWIDISGTVATDGDEAVVIGVGSTDAGRFAGQLDQGNCDAWTVTTSDGNPTFGELVTPSGRGQAVCTATHALACCSTPYVEKFRGFTAALSTGAPGSRAQMHAKCGTQFPGSHLCHIAEYYRTQSTTSIPATGAWVDASGFVQGTADVQVTLDVAPARAGRYGDQLDQGNCDNWTVTTADGNPTFGETIKATGRSETACTTALPLACCQ